MQLADFDYDLPPELVAQHPPAERGDARLLDAREAGAPAVTRHVRDLPQLLEPGDLLVVNDTRVVKARLHGRKDTGGVVEVLVERIDADDPRRVTVHLRSSRSPRAGQRLRLAEAFDAEVESRAGEDGSLFVLRFEADAHALLERHGHVPLPPYIARAEGDDESDDARRYQTIFADRPGAVAAPTASLHFDAPLLAALESRGIDRATVTLHVGAGTFLPVRGDSIEQHVMHRERYEVPQATVEAIRATRARGGCVVAVGTTSLRALESAALEGGGTVVPAAGDTGLFIKPGFEFRVVDRLLTNFHLPKSTLLMLVSAFAGQARIRALYAQAIAERYRFFSYGDAMLLGRSGEAA